MIVLTDVATKLQEILNSSDNTTTDFQFVVMSAGFHLDSVSDKNKKQNLIPVFISQIGGENNPVPNLKEINYTYEVNIYYPVRFKEDFYKLNTYLAETFVGKKIAFGSDNALCNINVAEYGEIIEFEAIREFENWVQVNFGGSFHLFKRDQQVNEFYMSMKFRLYCTTLGTGFSFANDVKFKLSATLPVFTSNKIVVNGDTYTRYSDGDDLTNNKYAWKFEESIIYTETILTNELNESAKLYELNNTYKELENAKISYSLDYVATESTTTESVDLVWDSSGTGASITPMSEQLVGVDKFAKNTPNITNFSKSIVVYPKGEDFWKTFMICYNLQSLDQIANLKLIKQYKIGSQTFEVEYEQLALSINENIELGSPLSLTVSFGDKK